MRKYFLFIGLAIGALLITLAMNSPGEIDRRATGIDRLYVFGDSLSDTGNVYRSTGKSSPPDPPYFQGRYSNGRVWVEFLAGKLGIKPDRVDNFAWGGATAGNDETVPSLLSQVREFSARERAIDPRALAVVWIGGNDYLRGTTRVTEPLANLSTALTSLSRLGIRRFLIVDLPDFGKIPATCGRENASSLSAVVVAHNRGLARIIDRLDRQFAGKSQFVEFSAYSLYNAALSHPDRFGFDNTRSACLNGKSICKHPDRFLFWDSIHPTEKAHRVTGERAYQVVEKAFWETSPTGTPVKKSKR
ncbi:SGNH/GDSL hydrolase family protein [Pannus brasiliensis CCIBt3594]|uniref:SGNH/GDSL hydrolase family protein n=1 Tax=Pannus brasiliensis CCIBt3594 TaxID=1427578 RepID=A0AAW9QRS4_9CHRO